MAEWYIVGLGNPGARYADTRHNVGRRAVTALAAADGSAWHAAADGAVQAASGEVGEEIVTYLLPERYMNCSGQALTGFGLSGEDASQLIVVHDDVDLPLGAVRIAYRRGHGGHNGLRDIIDQLGTTAFYRVRIGVAPRGMLARLRQPHGEATARFVLGRFLPPERAVAREAITTAGNAARTIIERGSEKAMQRYNTG